MTKKNQGKEPRTAVGPSPERSAHSSRKPKKRLRRFLLILTILTVSAFALPFLFALFSVSSASFAPVEAGTIALVGSRGIASCQMGASGLEIISERAVDVIQGSSGTAIFRLQPDDSTMVLAEEGPPHGEVSRLVSLDFMTGKAKFRKTSRATASFAGQTPGYACFGHTRSMSCFNPELKEVSSLQFEPALLGNSFFSTEETFSILETFLDQQYILVHTFENQNGHLVQTASRQIPWPTREIPQFGEFLQIGNMLYASCPVLRHLDTHERIVSSSIFVLNLETDAYSWIPVGIPAPYRLYFLGNGWIAADHAHADAGQPGISLISVDNQSAESLSLSHYGLPSSTLIRQIAMPDPSRLLILTDSEVIVYHLQNQNLESRTPFPDSLGFPVGIWPPSS